MDRTLLAPDPEGPDFSNKIISAKANSLGPFMVAALTEPQPPNNGGADLAITNSDSPDGVIVRTNLTHTLSITNNGPQTATGVVLTHALSPQTKFVSVNPTQGTCVESDGSVLCKLGSLSPGISTTVTVLVKPTEGGSTLPAQGEVFSSTAFARANEADPNMGDNVATENTTILPDNNIAPTTSITSPLPGVLLVGPTSVNITATASDSDGSVNSVEFYADGNLVGVATSGQPNEYTLAWPNVSFGPHSIIAVATDNLGKTAISESIMLFVNGSASVSLTSPAAWYTFSRPANISMTANAVFSGGTITKVDFYADGFKFIGTGALTGADQYSVTWISAPSGQHVLTALATDSTGVVTMSAPINIVVNERPVISLVGPAEGTVFSSAPASITLTANSSDWDGIVSRVDFFANGLLNRDQISLRSKSFYLLLDQRSCR